MSVLRVCIFLVVAFACALSVSGVVATCLALFRVCVCALFRVMFTVWVVATCLALFWVCVCVRVIMFTVSGVVATCLALFWVCVCALFRVMFTVSGVVGFVFVGFVSGYVDVKEPPFIVKGTLTHLPRRR